jgi:hypothetical protein
MWLFIRVDGDSKRRNSTNGSSWAAFKALWKRARDRKCFPTKAGNFFYTAKISPPYQDIQLNEHRIYLKGPRAIRWKDQLLFIGRAQNPNLLKKDIVLYHAIVDESAEKIVEFKPLLTLATGRDGSYAGLCFNPLDPADLWIAFYSDHARIGTPDQGKINDIWLARVHLQD